MPCSFDGKGQPALVPGASTGLAARSNFAALRQVVIQHLHLFVVNGIYFIGAEGANPAMRPEATTPTTARPTITTAIIPASTAVGAFS